MNTYFNLLSKDNSMKICVEIKQQQHKLKVAESFEWFEYIKNRPEKPWEYNYMCASPNVTWELIQAYPEFFIDYNFMCENPNITFDIMQTFPFPLTQVLYMNISRNPNVSLETVNQFPEKPWYYPHLAMNSNFHFYEMLNDSNWKKFES